jgi:hypothetical protein
MTEFKVLITGLVLLTAQELYVTGGDKKAGAALAIAVPETNGKYDVEIPEHDPLLTIKKTDIAEDGTVNPPTLLIKGTDPGRVDASDAALRIVRLSGDRISFGEYDPKVPPVCKVFLATAGNVADDSSGALNQIPRFSQLGITSFTLLPKAKPDMGDFSTVSPALVAGWLDLPRGRLAVKHADDDKIVPVAEFRPSRHQQVMASRVMWRAKTAEKMRGCIVVEPFKDPPNSDPDIVIFLKGDVRTIQYTNLAMDDSGEKHDFASYDFEMFYNVLATPPAVPPIPYPFGSHKIISHAHDGETAPAAPDLDAEGIEVNGITGVNCGPARLP